MYHSLSHSRWYKLHASIDLSNARSLAWLLSPSNSFQTLRFIAESRLFLFMQRVWIEFFQLLTLKQKAPMRDHDGAPESRKTRNKCSEQSPDRSGRQTGVNQPPQQCSFPLKPSDSPSIDLRIDDNCKRRHPPPIRPGPPPPGLLSQLAQPGSMWPVRSSALLFCWLFMGGLFN